MQDLKLNKKGFTLIELLAVIVVLAIIIVIAVPSVLNIQKNAKMGTTKDEALLLVKSVELCLASEQKLDKCAATGSGTNISKYYDKTIDGTNITYTLGGTVDAPTITAFNYTNNGYTVKAGSTADAANGTFKSGQSLSSTKTAIDALWK